VQRRQAAAERAASASPPPEPTYKNAPPHTPRNHGYSGRTAFIALPIDNSGSMRGGSIIFAIARADTLARTLERCSIKIQSPVYRRPKPPGSAPDEIPG